MRLFDISSNYPTKFDVHDFSKNSMSLINLMDYWISRLSSLHYIYDEIMSITIGQTDKFITQTEYEQVRNAVIENLSNSLRIIWTEGLQKAWITFIELISDILIRTQKELVNSIK
jgi:hemoglobin-like flavoprotein